MLYIVAMAILKERKMQKKYMLRVVDDDIESPYKVVPDVFLFLFIKL